MGTNRVGEMSYRVIDLFAGAGGMSLGFSDPRFCGGFKSVLAIDNDLAATKTYAQNFGDHALCVDIEEWLRAGPDIPQADVVIGGPPCQGFSLLNKQRAGDVRRQLWQPYMDVVERSGASAFVIENVAELKTSPEHALICERASRMGFKTTSAVLLAADYGSPQTRKRTVIVGWRSGTEIDAPFPPLPTHASPEKKSNLLPWRTVRDAIGDLAPPQGTEPRDVAAPFDLHFGRNPTPKSRARYKAVPLGGNRFDLQRNAPELTPDCWVRKVSGGTDLFGRLWWDRPSVTIRTEFFKPEKGRYLHPVQDRPITHREAARLMGFPDDFKFIGTKTEIARQIGNAVPPHLGGAIGLLIRDLLEGVSAREAA